MYTSDNSRDLAVRISVNYLAAALFCALFGAVYEIFSHEVYSYPMIYAFAIPLAGGALPFLAFAAGLLFPQPVSCGDRGADDRQHHAGHSGDLRDDQHAVVGILDRRLAADRGSCDRDRQARAVIVPATGRPGL